MPVCVRLNGVECSDTYDLWQECVLAPLLSLTILLYRGVARGRDTSRQSRGKGGRGDSGVVRNAVCCRREYMIAATRRIAEDIITVVLSV